MGMKYPFGKDIDPETELKILSEKSAKSVKMKMLVKDEEFTWWNGTGSSMKKSNLDQVVATENISFKKYGSAEIKVLGWPKESTDEKKTEWIKRYSDHGIMYLEVMK